MFTTQTLREMETQTWNRRIGRRGMLQTVAAGAVGIGLAGGASTASADELKLPRPKPGELPKIDPTLLQKRSTCPDLLRVSKHLRARLYRGDCRRCPCGRDVNFIVTYKLHGFLFSNDACDETAEIWPNKTEVVGEATMTLRQTKCESGLHLVGCNEGKVEIRGKSAGVVSELFGTQGFDTHASGGKRCCAPDHGEGTWKGRGYEKLEGCRLCLSYVSRVFSLNPKDPCEKRSLDMTAQLDGVLICPCKK